MRSSADMAFAADWGGCRLLGAYAVATQRVQAVRNLVAASLTRRRGTPRILSTRAVSVFLAAGI